MIVFLSFSQAFNQIFMKDITLGRANYHADRVLYDIAEIANIKIYCHKKKKWAQGFCYYLMTLYNILTETWAVKSRPAFVPYFTRALILFSIVKNVHK